MDNKNFVDWELTQLLPKKNPYSKNYWYKNESNKN